MNIFYAFDDAYAALAGISIYSLLENNKDCNSIRFYIVDSGISKINREKIENLIIESGQEITFYEMPGFARTLGNDIDVGRWNINVYSKLFVGGILPDDVHKVISVDCDTVIVKSLEELWNTDVSSAIVAGVNEAMSKHYRRYLGKEDKDYYFNSGLLVFNVDAMRKENYEAKFLECMKKYGSSLAYLDQDAINAVVPNNRMVAVSPKFNAITPIFCCSYQELIKTRRASAYYTEAEFNEARKEPHIIHFTTFFMNDLRPWFEGSQHPKLDEFLKYKNASPWKGEPFWEDKRGKKAKFKDKIITALPRSLQCELSSFIHGVVVPKKNRKKMEKARRVFNRREKTNGAG